MRSRTGRGSSSASPLLGNANAENVHRSAPSEETTRKKELYLRLEEVYDLTHTGTMTTAPRLALRDNVLTEAQQYDDPYHRAAALL